jgi:Flp pilus assembly protein TadG
MAAVVVVLVLGMLVVGRVGRAVVERARARTAADAAALAGVRDGREAAGDLAARNGGRLATYVESGTEVEVTVRVGDEQASARASLEAGLGGGRPTP